MSKEEFTDLYTKSLYTKRNPDYHQKDSKFKWRNFEKCIKKSINKKKFKTSDIFSICEIGCGSGGILNYLKQSNLFMDLTNLEGWDINPGAIKMAMQKYPSINFFNKNLFENDKLFDLIICSDVFEHVENPYEFLNKLNIRSKYFLFNIPLEMNLLSMIQGKKIFKKTFESVGHLHFYSAPSANLILEVTNYEIIYSQFAKDRTRNFFASPSLRKLFATIPQFFIELLNPHFASLLMGDHLVILARRKDVN